MVANLAKKYLPQRWANRIDVNRVLTDVLLVLLIVFGWMLLNTQNDLERFQTCTRDYLARDRSTADIRLQASYESQRALNESLSSIPPLLDRIIESSESPSPEDSAEALQQIRDTNQAFLDYAVAFAEYEQARERFPKPPRPEKFCEE